MPKLEDLPKNLSKLAYGDNIVEEYKNAYTQLSELATQNSEINQEEKKYNEMRKKSLIQYANSLQLLIQAKSQNREANDLIEEVLQNHNKLLELEKAKKIPEREDKEGGGINNKLPAEHKKIALKQKKKKPIEKIEEPTKKMKTSLIISGNEQIEEKEAEKSVPLPSKGHSYLNEYLKLQPTPSAEENKQPKKKKEDKAKDKTNKKVKMLKITEEDEFYQKAYKDQQNAIQEKKNLIEKEKEQHKQHAKKMFEKAQRNIDYNILKAKGLTRKRKKIDRNPRVKLRAKYEKAVKQRKVYNIILFVLARS